MALENDIATIINTLYPDATFMLASRLRADINSFHVESDELPLIVLDNEFKKENEIQANGSTTKKPRLVIWFLNQDTPDNTDAQTLAIQQAMELMADRTAQAIFRLQNIKPQGNQKYNTTPLFHRYNSDLSGVALEILANENTVITCE